MATHDEYDRKLLIKGIDKIADRLDKIERKIPGEVEQTGDMNLSTLYKLAKENECSMHIGFYPGVGVYLEVIVSPAKRDYRIVNSKCSMEDMLDTFKDIIRTAKEGSDE